MKNKKIIIFVTAMVLVFAMVTGATFAYLTTQASKVTNTFVSGGFGKIELREFKDDGNNDAIDWFTGSSAKTNQYTVVPGVNINKNPTVKFTFDDTTPITDAYIFVTIEYDTSNANYNWRYTTGRQLIAKVNGTDSLTVNIANTWYVVSSTNGKIVLCYGSSSAAQTRSANLGETKIFANLDGSTNKTIAVSSAMTEDMCEKMNTNKAKYSLNISAYAIQSETFNSASAAWTALQAELS
jgi:hypothetical protein